MAFTHTDKNPGDLIRSADWNDMGREVTRLNTDKVDLAGNQTVTGPLTVRADLGVGTANAGAQLRIFRKQEDARDLSNQGALVVGTDSPSSASLRVGYAQAYSWLQGQGQQILAINPRGGDVGVGTDTPRSRLSVAGALSVGAAYASGSVAPANSLIVEGSVGIGTAAPGQKLSVEGNARVNGNLDVTGAVSFGQATRQMVNLWGAGYGIGVQGATTYFRSDGHFAFYRGGTHSDTALTPGAGGAALLAVLNSGNVGVGTLAPAARLHVAGGNLQIDANQEIFFADNGQIRSTDNNHRILFRRSENKLELREYGDIIFSSGATTGVETARAVLRGNGYLGLGTGDPKRQFHMEGTEVHSGGTGAGYSFSNRESSFIDSGNAGERWVLYSSGKVARLWTGSDKLTVDANGTLTASSFAFGNGSSINGDQGGSIELGGNNGKANATGAVPYIDFHFGSGRVEDYNARIINDGDGQLTVDCVNNFRVTGAFAVTLGCADFRIGHASRRKATGRALVDNTNTLELNYGTDWPSGVRYWGTWSQASSRELKDGIEVLGLDEAERIVAELTPVRYHLKADENRAQHLGFIAEEVPEEVATLDRTAIAPNHIVAALTRVVKEQQRRIDELSRRIDGELANA